MATDIGGQRLPRTEQSCGERNAGATLAEIPADLVGTLLSGYIIVVAAGRGPPPSAAARMAINVALEGIVGLVPIAGDLFDAA